MIFPTTTFCGLIIVGRGATPANDKAAVRWQPSAEDLLANDWVLSH
ncbi:Thoeris anti-defense Tad2 family protein [Ligilactobacillus agilis]